MNVALNMNAGVQVLFSQLLVSFQNVEDILYATFCDYLHLKEPWKALCKVTKKNFEKFS